jgi:HD-like signal output (HDOD) protein
MTRPRVLFVDDELPVLEGLQNQLRKYRGVWDMSFVSSGAAALDRLATAPADVVVSDMRMPGMDGAALLAEVKTRHPAAVRLVLSGHADHEAVLRAVPVAHQYLSKPCDATVLRHAIDRACVLQARLHDPSVRALVGQLAQVPSVPQVYWDLTAILSRPNVSMADVAAVIERDPAMAAKLLQLVNSAYFGLARRVTSIEQAVMYLGIELVRSLALTVQVFGCKGVTAPGMSLDALQGAALCTARLARQLVATAAAKEDAFTASLLRDLGQVVLASAQPLVFGRLVAEAASTGRPLHDIEREAHGSSHAEVGGYLLGVWGLPIEIVEAVACHHAPSLAPPESVELVRAVHVAGALVDAATAEYEGVTAPETLDLAFLERTGGCGDLERWRAVAREHVREALASTRRGPA